jgi:hypothetical protein
MSLRPFRSPRPLPGDGRPGRTLVFSVGRRFFVNGPAGGVPLTDDAGRDTAQRLADGTEVEIVAWRPRGRAGTRYRVQSTGEVRAEGWLGAESLRDGREPEAPAPPRSPVEPGAGGDERPKFGQRR